ncbi:MAG: hypothetical protein LBE91_16225 [Tannerella sp.]|nr:hypothetical protein [Tannerella sp.]
MSTITLDRPKYRQQRRIVLNVAPRKYKFLMELLGNFNFVQIEESEGDTREEIIDNLKEAAKSLKLIREGKLIGRPAEELLNEL